MAERDRYSENLPSHAREINADIVFVKMISEVLSINKFLALVCLFSQGSKHAVIA